MENPTRTPEEQAKKNSNWFVRHKVLTGILGIFVFFVIIGMLGGEDSGLGDTKISAGTNSSSESLQDLTYMVGEDVRIGDVRWKVLEAKDRGNTLKASESKYAGIATTKTTPGKFVQVSVEVENLGSELKSATSLQLVDDKGREFTSSSDTSEWVPEGKEMYILSNLNPNVPASFIEIYEVPADATGLKLEVGDLSLTGNDSALIDLGF